MSCNHAAHNWNVVYQCRNCNEIVPEEIAEGHLAQLEADNETLREAGLRLVGGWVESGDGATDKALEDMRNLLRAVLTEEASK